MEEFKKNHPKEEKPAEKRAEKLISVKEEEYLRLKEEAAKSVEYWEKLLRLQADFENSRKRMERDRQEFLKFANEEILTDLLNVLDDLERAINLAEAKHEDLPAFLKGIEMILAHLYEMLKEYGIKPIEAQGKIFDPNYHEALMQVEDTSVPEHTILEELQKGYLLNERVIRTAKVKLAKSGPQSTVHGPQCGCEEHKPKDEGREKKDEK